MTPTETPIAEAIRPTFSVCGKTFDNEGEAQRFLLQKQRRDEAHKLLSRAVPSSGELQFGRPIVGQPHKLLEVMQANPAAFRQILNVLAPQQEAK